MGTQTEKMGARNAMNSDSRVVSSARQVVETLKTRAKYIREKLLADGYSVGAANYMRRELAALDWSIRFIEFSVRAKKRAIAARQTARAAKLIAELSV